LGAGLLGMVLAWLLLKHLPAKDAQIQQFVADKDKQVASVLADNATDRDQDRKAREELAAVFQKAHSDMEKVHREDAEKDRKAFVERNSQVVDAIKIQTGELKAAIASSCRFAGPVVQVTPKE
jgi:hypothetical protein